MSSSEDQTLSGVIFDESTLLTIQDLSRMCAVEERHIAGNSRERGCADVDLPGTDQAQDFRTVQAHFRPSGKLDVDLSV